MSVSVGAPLAWYARRLRAMSVREAAWRASSRIRPERAKAGEIEAPDWSDPVRRAQLVSMFEPLREQLAEDAARIATGERQLWGRRVDLAKPIDWRRDPFNGEALGDAGRGSELDRKPIWELHRHQHLLPLAAAAALESDRDQARICVEELLGWIEANPRSAGGPGWSLGYETSHRLVGWALVVPLIAPLIDDPRGLDRLAAAYAEQVAFVRSDPSRFSSANNHRLAELTGLLAAASVGAFADARGALEGLTEELGRQLHTDGGSREQAGGYFLYVLEIGWSAALFARITGLDAGELERHLAGMLEWAIRAGDEALEPPPLGDDAEDRMLRIDYFQPRRAAAICGRVAALLRGVATADPEPIPHAAKSSVLLGDSGLAVLRPPRRSCGEGSGRITFDVGPLGLGSLAAHGHADALSVLWDHDGDQLLCDMGTFSYMPSGGRHHHRSTAAHNTVEIEGRDQAEQWGPHMWGPRFRTTIEASDLGGDCEYVRASHDGYSRLDGAPRHVRSVLLLREPRLLVVLDRITAERPVEAILRWHLGVLEGGGPSLEVAGGRLRVAGSPDPLPSSQRVPFSDRYTHRGECLRLSWTAEARRLVFATAVSLDNELSLDLRESDDAVEVRVEAERSILVREDWVQPRPEIVEVEASAA